MMGVTDMSEDRTSINRIVDNRDNEIIRIQKKRNNFVMLDKGFLNDERLSFKAKGILAYLLSKPDNWKVIVGDLIKRSSDGKKSIYSGLRELKACGYYIKRPVRDAAGRRISYWESVILECPDEPIESQDDNSENSLFTQKGEVEKNPLISTSSLLTPFVHVENVDIQNVDIQNGQHNNNNISNKEVNNDLMSVKSVQASDHPVTVEIKDDMTPTMTIDNDYNVANIDFTQNKKDFLQNHATTAGLESPHEKISDTDQYTTYLKIIQDNIDYQYFNNDIDLVDNIVSIMLDVILTEDPPTVRIRKEVKTRALVKSVYLKLSYSHIQHVIDQFKRQNHEINEKTNYLRSMLYTTYHEIDVHYTNQVRADGLV